MKVLYAGYGIFGCSGLVELLGNGISVTDIKALRNGNESESCMLIDSFCRKYGIRQLTEDEAVKGEYDILISVHWRKRLCSDLVQDCKYGGINLHPSLLPKYAGCSSLAWALAHGESEVGFTWHTIEQEFDTGKIVLQQRFEVNEWDNAFTLFNRINQHGVSRLMSALARVISDGFEGEIQDLVQRSYYGRGFPSFKDIKLVLPEIKRSTYDKAAYFPGR